MTFEHTPVMAGEVMDRLITRTDADAVYIDGTLGGGGHAELLLEKTSSHLIGIDRDPAALAAAGKRLARFGDRFSFIHGNHADMSDLIAPYQPLDVRGVLLDLGVSSHQFDEPSRGFSYNYDAPLDMRMDTTQRLSAADVVNGYSEADLANVIYEFAEERFSRRIASAIVRARPITTTLELAEIVINAIPVKGRIGGPHPARRTFMALRIEVNGELERLKEALNGALACLSPGGRLCVITFHSLEDRIVKQALAEWANPCVCPPKTPVCICGKKQLAVLTPRKAIPPSDAEVQMNPRARSAMLRVAEKI